MPVPPLSNLPFHRLVSHEDPEHMVEVEDGFIQLDQENSSGFLRGIVLLSYLNTVMTQNWHLLYVGISVGRGAQLPQIKKDFGLP